MSYFLARSAAASALEPGLYEWEGGGEETMGVWEAALRRGRRNNVASALEPLPLEGGGGRDNVWGRGSNVSRGEETMYVGEDTMCVLRMTGYPLPPSLAQITSSTTATLPLRRSHPIQPVHKDRPTLTRFEPQNNSIPTAISTGTTMMA